ncbi:MAG: 1-deoxy-D-xylulose-5-phosphate synthase, partial [Simkania negevensis]|nr:1-deoxy-D-xylulose-5-phosphate synthase [Simkania negevensis]
GLTLEAMNNLPKDLKKFIVILNDNAMSISKNVGAVTKILSRFFRSSTGNNLYKEFVKLFSKIPKSKELLKSREIKIKESLKNLVSTAPFFEQFGLSYVGPINGHDIKKLIETFEVLKNCDQPTLVHVLTIKGQGMQHAMNDPTPYHGAKPFDRTTGVFYPAKNKDPTFPEIFGNHMAKLADEDPQLVSITPAMPAGSCLDSFMKRHPKRCIDVGIAEGHSVTYAGGIGFGGKLKVVCCVYSTFLQRAFDNIYHDVCIQNIPIVFAIDRSGLACGDGATAQGLYDISFLQAMPNLVIAQPRNGDLLKSLLESSFSWNRPVAIRYPNLKTTETQRLVEKRELGKGEIVAYGEDLLILPLGHMCSIALEVRENLLQRGIGAAVIDPIFVKPLDEELLLSYLNKEIPIVTIEEHSLQGGFGSIINSFICTHQLTHLKVLNFGLPDLVIDHGSHSDLL